MDINKKILKKLKNYKIIQTETKKQYYLIVVDDITNDLFTNFLLYILKIINTKNIYLAIDLEFNSKEIACFQLNFDIGLKHSTFMFIINYDSLNENSKNIFINDILTNKKIKKLLHGANSGDIPKLINNIFINKEQIQNFINSYYDTRFICEFLINKNQMTSKLCGIYDMLLKFNIINKEKYEELMINNHMMGEIKDNWIDIKLLSKEMEKYIIYDVVYLIDIFKYFKKELKNVYKLISEFNRIIILDTYSDIISQKLNIKYFNISTNYKILYDSLNINFLTLKNKNNIILKSIDFNNTKIKPQLNSLFENIFNKYNEFNNNNLELLDQQYIYKINNYKKYIIYYFKIITFNYLCSISNININIKNNSYISTDDINNIKQSYKDLYKFIDDNKYVKIKKIFNQYEEYISYNL